MIKEIINSLRKISTTTNSTLIVVSLYRHHHHHYSSFPSSYLYEKILLPRFDKCIEITNNKKEKVNNVLDIKTHNHKNHHNEGISKNRSRRFSLPERDLMQLILSTRWFFVTRKDKPLWLLNILSNWRHRKYKRWNNIFWFYWWFYWCSSSSSDIYTIPFCYISRITNTR